MLQMIQTSIHMHCWFCLIPSGPVDKIMYVEAIDKYVTCSRDGSFRLWNGTDLKHFRTMHLVSMELTSVREHCIALMRCFRDRLVLA
jgi:hypothetical protein